MKAFAKKTDNDLIQLFVEGNTEALEILVLRHKDKLYTSILFLVKDKYLAEDIFQDVFIRIIDTMRSGRYTEEGKFLPWAMRIAHNLCVDHFRKVKRTPTIKNGDDKDIFEVVHPCPVNKNNIGAGYFHPFCIGVFRFCGLHEGSQIYAESLEINTIINISFKKKIRHSFSGNW